MAVKVVNKETGETVSGKLAILKEGNVILYSGCMSDKKGGLRGCGKKQVFAADSVSVSADDPAREIKSS